MVAPIAGTSCRRQQSLYGRTSKHWKACGSSVSKLTVHRNRLPVVMLILCLSSFFLRRTTDFNYRQVDPSLVPHESIFIAGPTDINISHSNFIANSARCDPRPLSIGIFIAANARAQELYDKNINSIRCYGKRHGYDVIIVNDLNATTVISMRQKQIGFLDIANRKRDCSSIASFSFQRQCMVSQILPHYDFLVVLDADIGVVNANVTMESVLLKTSMDYNSSKCSDPFYSMSTTIPHIIHEERFHTGEVMAAAFILQNTPFAQAYLSRWISYYYMLPEPQYVAPNKYANKFYHKLRDNPALNMVFLETLAEIVTSRYSSNDKRAAVMSNHTYRPLIDNCHRLWKLSRGALKYSNYLNCIQNATATIVSDGMNLSPKGLNMKERNVMFPLYLFRRGHGGLGRDVQTCKGMVSPLDIFVHNLKDHNTHLEHTDGFYTQKPTCDNDGTHRTFDTEVSEWQAPVSDDRWRSLDEMKALMKMPACLSKTTRIGSCWPNCSILPF